MPSPEEPRHATLLIGHAEETYEEIGQLTTVAREKGHIGGLPYMSLRAAETGPAIGERCVIERTP